MNNDDIKTNIQTGSSGATLVFEKDEVKKFDAPRTGTRVRDQGIWLRNHTTIASLPQVYRVLSNGYEMELLKQPELEDLISDRANICQIILDNLQVGLWGFGLRGMGFEALNYYNARQHRRYVAKLLNQAGLAQHRKTLDRYAASIDWPSLQRALTHGDPIAENLLYRQDLPFAKPSWVLIDPIPSCSALPDVEALDVGRVIQTAVGYERIRYNRREVADKWDAHPPRVAVAEVLNMWLDDDRGFDLNEARAAVYFAAIHTARGVRTAPAEPIRHELQLLVGKLVEEVERWMR